MSADPMRPSDWWVLILCLVALAVVWFSVLSVVPS